MLAEVPNEPSGERFYMPLIYKPDPEWARIMQQSVSASVKFLNQNPRASFDELVTTLISEARSGLTSRAKAFRGSSDIKTKIKSHAESFGVSRKGSQRVTFIGETGPLSEFAGEAQSALTTFGSYTEEEHRWGPFSTRAGQAFKKPGYEIQHTFDTPQGKVNLCHIESTWIPTHEEEYLRLPFGQSLITSPKVDVVIPMHKASDLVLDTVKELKTGIDQKGLAQDEATLRTVTDYTHQLYWMASQSWAYERGSAGIADLTAKTIFDWLNVYTPLWKDTANPNIIALLNPLEAFQRKVPKLYQDSLRWNSSSQT